MSSAESKQQTEQFTVVQWAAFAFVALLPWHAVSIDVGFSLKPWFIPLLIGLAVAFRDVIRTALSLPRAIQVGIVCQVDTTHRPSAELADDLVPANSLQ